MPRLEKSKTKTETTTDYTRAYDSSDDDGPQTLHTLYPHKLPKFSGDGDVETLIREAKLMMRLQPMTNAVAISWLLEALEGPARQLILSMDVQEVDMPAKIFAILEQNWGDQRDYTSLATAFYSRKQGLTESVGEYAAALRLLWAKTNTAKADTLSPDMLRDNFADGLHPASLRRDVKRFLREKPQSSFLEATKEAQRWMREDMVPELVMAQTTVADPGVLHRLEAELATLRAEIASLREQLQQRPPTGHCRNPSEPPPQSPAVHRPDPDPDPPYCLWCARQGHTEAQCRSKRRYLERSRRQEAAAARAKQHRPAVVSSQVITKDSPRQHKPASKAQKSFLPQLSQKELCQRQRDDPTIGPILNCWPTKPSVSQNWQLHALVQQHERLVLRKGVLYRRVMDPKQGASEQLIIPSSLRPQLLSSLHHCLGHQDYRRAAEVLRPQAYWPGMYTELEEYLATCRPCSKVYPPSCVRAAPARQPLNSPQAVFCSSLSIGKPCATEPFVASPVPAPRRRQRRRQRRKPDGHQQSRLERARPVPAARHRLLTTDTDLKNPTQEPGSVSPPVKVYTQSENAAMTVDYTNGDFVNFSRAPPVPVPRKRL